MYKVTGRARARKNKDSAKVLNNFKYLSWGFIEMLVQWTRISSNTQQKTKLWLSCKLWCGWETTGGALAVGNTDCNKQGNTEQSLLWQMPTFYKNIWYNQMNSSSPHIKLCPASSPKALLWLTNRQQAEK